MPSVSGQQHRFAGMSSTAAGRSKLRAEGKKPMPEGVAKEYLSADKGRRFGSVGRKKGGK